MGSTAGRHLPHSADWDFLSSPGAFLVDIRMGEEAPRFKESPNARLIELDTGTT